MPTSPLDFFDLDEFQHRSLFDGAEHVWQALDRLPEYLARHRQWGVFGEVAPSAVLVGQILLPETAAVEPGAMIVGPTIIGDHCRVRHGAYLRGNIILADACLVGHCSEIKSSIFLPGAKAPHFNYVGDSILGRDVNLGAGARCANLRFDGQEISVHTGDPDHPDIPTGRRKLGAIIGDRTQTACNVVLNPGALLPPDSTVHFPPRA